MIQIDHYKILKKLDDGIQSEVLLASDERTGQKVAIKVFNDKHMHLIKNEVKVIKKFDHANVIKYITDGKTSKILNGRKQCITYLVTEYASKGNLLSLVASSGGLTEDFTRFYMQQLVSAVQHMYEQGFVHRDLKLENFLLDEGFNLKLCDFGFAGGIKGMKGTGFMVTVLGTIGYMAPEIFLGKSYHGEKVDSFAMGVVLFIMVFKRPPFVKARMNDRLYKLIHAKKLDAFWKAHSLGTNDDSPIISDEFKDLVMALLTSEPENRLSLEQISKHPWMREGTVPSTDELITEMDKRFEASLLELEKNEKDKDE